MREKSMSEHMLDLLTDKRIGKNSICLTVLYTVCTMSLAVTCGADEVYRILNEDGSYTFTDIPPSGKKAEKVVVPQPNILPALKEPENAFDIDVQTDVPTKETAETSSNTSGKNQSLDVDKALYDLTILSPIDGMAFDASNSFVKIDLGISPSLSSDHLIYVLLNNKQYGSGGNVLTRLIPSLPKGIHMISATIKTKDGEKVVARARSISIEVVEETPVDTPETPDQPTFEKTQ